MPSGLGHFAFIESSLDRLSELREQLTLLDEQRAHPNAQLLIVSLDGHVLLKAEHDSLLLPAIGLDTEFSLLSFLGHRHSVPIFCASMSVSDIHGYAERYRGVVADLRVAAASVLPEEAGLLAYARALLHWQRRKQYCGVCGGKTKITNGGHRAVCSQIDCGAEYFPRIDPAIIVLVSSGDHCLLGRQASWPEHRYSTLAGFVEPGETLEQALSREVLEETGVRVDECRYLASQPWPFPASLMLGFEAQAQRQVVRVGAELSDAQWFSADQIPKLIQAGQLRLPPKISISYHLIARWFRNITGASL
jgi:NAD+ diphosphatase